LDLHHGLKPPRAFEHHGSCFYRDLQPSSSRDPPPRRSIDSEASSSGGLPLMAGDFVPDSFLGTVTKLVEEQSRRDVDKKVEWLRKQAAQDACYIELFDSE
jgi:hypothetical protein